MIECVRLDRWMLKELDLALVFEEFVEPCGSVAFQESTTKPEES